MCKQLILASLSQCRDHCGHISWSEARLDGLTLDGRRQRPLLDVLLRTVWSLPDANEHCWNTKERPTSISAFVLRELLRSEVPSEPARDPKA
jgi:hypothetical protein